MGDALAEAEAYLNDARLIDSAGAVLYSASTTLRPGPVYLLGLNPGGTEGATLRDSIAKAKVGHNAYLDEQWAPGGNIQPIGKSTLQRRIQNLCELMGLATRDVPASNLVFTRSTRIGTHLDFDTALPLCFPVHRIFFEAVQPQFLMTFGAIGNFAKAVDITSIESRSAEHGTWMSHRGKAVFSGKKIAFGNVPHMSLWASDKRRAVVEWALGLMSGNK